MSGGLVIFLTKALHGRSMNDPSILQRVMRTCILAFGVPESEHAGRAGEKCRPTENGQEENYYDDKRNRIG